MLRDPDPHMLAAFQALIDDPDVDENEIQTFLEINTAFIETPHLLNHHLNLNCIVTKFKVGPWTTDFAYLTKSTVAWRLVLVEIERPDKRIFQQSNKHDAFHADFNNAVAQIDAWRDLIERDKANALQQL